MAKPNAPRQPTGPACRKCGEQGGWHGPTYQKGKRVEVYRPTTPNSFRSEFVETTESLVYTCAVCGAERHEPCKDSL